MPQVSIGVVQAARLWLHNSSIVQERTLLHRATYRMEIQKAQGDVIADVCIVPFAPGGHGWFAGDYTGWPQGAGE